MWEWRRTELESPFLRRQWATSEFWFTLFLKQHYLMLIVSFGLCLLFLSSLLIGSGSWGQFTHSHAHLHRFTIAMLHRRPLGRGECCTEGQEERSLHTLTLPKKTWLISTLLAYFPFPPSGCRLGWDAGARRTGLVSSFLRRGWASEFCVLVRTRLHVPSCLSCPSPTRLTLPPPPLTHIYDVVRRPVRVCGGRAKAGEIQRPSFKPPLPLLLGTPPSLTLSNASQHTHSPQHP